MKNILSIASAIILSVTFSLGIFAQTVNGSADYMDELSPAFDKIKVKTWDYLSVVSQGRGAFLVEASRQSLLNEIIDAKEEMKLAPSFNGNDEFRQALINYFDKSSTILKEDFDEILDMEAISSQTYDAMEAYLTAKEQANKKLDEEYFHLLTAQKKFADDNKLILHRPADDIMTKQIEKTGRILSYYNNTYLIFFRVFKQESRVMYAIQKNDLEDFNWNNKILEFEASVGLEKIHALQAFEGDSVLIKAALKSLEFYYREATVDSKATEEYYESKKSYAAAKAEFEKIPQEDLVQADADKINKIGRAYNDAVQNFHAMNKARNKERVDHLNEWNRNVEQFFKTHSM